MVSDHNVLDRGHVLEETDVLKSAGDAESGDLVGWPPRDVGPGEDDPPAGGFVQARDDVEEGRLAGAVRSDEADDRPFRDREVDRAHRDESTELLGDRHRLEDSAAHSSISTSTARSWAATTSPSSAACSSAFRRALGKSPSGRTNIMNTSAIPKIICRDRLTSMNCRSWLLMAAPIPWTIPDTQSKRIRSTPPRRTPPAMTPPMFPRPPRMIMQSTKIETEKSNCSGAITCR